MDLTPDDLDAAVRTVWGEARGEKAIGEDAVAHVIFNRASHPGWWGTSVKEICTKKWQFSCWLESDPNRSKLLSLSPNDPVYVTIEGIVKAVFSGTEADPTNGATVYKVTGTPASWDAVPPRVPCAVIGHHSFYKNVTR